LKTERIELSEEDQALLDQVRREGESYGDALSRLLAGVEIVNDLAAETPETGIQHPYEND